MAVHTPTLKVTTCEILPQGKFVVLALDKHPNLVTLRLHYGKTSGGGGGGDQDEEETVLEYVYGSKENEAKVFQL